MISLSLGFPCATSCIKENFVNLDMSLKQVINNDRNICTENVEKNLRADSLFHALMSETVFYLYFLCILHILEGGNDSTIQRKHFHYL